MAVFAVLCVADAYAVSMCVPTLSGMVKTNTTYNANNRGQFAFGGSCVADNATYSVVCTSAPVARGEYHCGASGMYGASNWENGGGYLWVRITGVRAPNGYLAPRNGSWVLVYNITNGRCHDLGSNYIYNLGKGLRRVLFSAFENEI